MKKIFNITGLCIPEKHYMVDTSAKLDAIMAMVEKGEYFVINRPRQYGKTTTLALLEERLQTHPPYLPLFISFEGISAESYQNEPQFLQAFFEEVRLAFEYVHQEASLPLFDEASSITSLFQLGRWITKLVTMSRQRVVFMIDEVDKSSNHHLFLDFLALLRTKYLNRERGKETTFHSVILAGVHDVKSLKLKIRPDDDRKYNSPWNIAVDFPIDLSFSPHEIQTMLAEYVEATGVEMDQTQIAERLWYYTSGYPFLVSAVCKIIDEDLKRHTTWQTDDVDEAVSQVLLKQNTNFEHLIKNLEHSQAFATLVEHLVLLETPIPFNQDNPLIHLGVQYGILSCQNNSVAIHNRIYQERIYNYLTSKLETGELISRSLERYAFQPQFLTPDSALDVARVLLKFQEFMKQEYSQRDVQFLERHGRLVFFAFLRPILNGRGFALKEPQISEEKRLDVVITFGSQKHIIELKIWRGDEAHQAGLRQLAEYLDRTGHQEGALVIFDFTQKGQKTWKQEHIQIDGKDIFAVWV